MTEFNKNGWPEEWPKRTPMTLGKFNHFSNQIFETLYADRGVHFEPTLEQIDQLCALTWDLISEKEKANANQVEDWLRKAAAGYARDDSQWLRAERLSLGAQIVVTAAEKLLELLESSSQKPVAGQDEAEEKLREKIDQFRENAEDRWERPKINLVDAMKSVIAWYEEQELKGT